MYMVCHIKSHINVKKIDCCCWAYFMTLDICLDGQYEYCQKVKQHSSLRFTFEDNRKHKRKKKNQFSNIK